MSTILKIGTAGYVTVDGQNYNRSLCSTYYDGNTLQLGLPLGFIAGKLYSEYLDGDNSNTPFASISALRTWCNNYLEPIGAISKVQVSLSSANILALNSTPITIIPTQGSGKFIVPIAIIFDYTNVTTAYTSGSLNFQLGGVTYAVITSANSIGSVSSIARSVIQNSAGAQATGVQILTEGALTLTSASNPTGGDGTAKVTVYYQVMTR